MFKTKFHIFTVIFIILFLHLFAGIYYNNYSFWWIFITAAAYFLFLFLGSFFIRWGFYFKSRQHLSTIKLNILEGKADIIHLKNIALTFDDGPHQYTTEILDILKEEQVKATFFVIGKNILGNEEVLKRIASEGHAIGNHSYYHGRAFDWQSSKKMIRELEKTNQLIEGNCGLKTNIFRPPYGVTNPNLSKALEQTQMESIAWSVRSFDTIVKSETKLLKTLKSKTKAGSIVLLHDSSKVTRNILPEFIQFLKSKDYEFETIK